MLTKKFWKGAAERGVKTFAQTWVAVVTIGIGSEAVGVGGVLTGDLALTGLAVAGTATLLSVATSIGSADFTAGEPPVDPELTDGPVDPERYPDAWD